MEHNSLKTNLQLTWLKSDSLDYRMHFVILSFKIRKSVKCLLILKMMKFIKQCFFFIPSVSKWLTDCKHKNREEQRIVNKRILNILLSIGSSIYTDVASRYCKYQYDIKFFTLLNTIFNLSDDVTQSITMGDPFSTEY